MLLTLFNLSLTVFSSNIPVHPQKTLPHIIDRTKKLTCQLLWRRRRPPPPPLSAGAAASRTEVSGPKAMPSNIDPTISTCTEPLRVPEVARL
jgi:hypothetical protein